MLGKDRNTLRTGQAEGSGTFLIARDYRRYQLKGSDILICTGEAVLLAAAISWLFYRSVWGMAFTPAAMGLLCSRRKRKKCREQQQKLRLEFRECIRIVTASMYSGYSVENAFCEAEKEMLGLLGEEADMYRELCVINQQIQLNRPVETVLAELADKSGVEEISRFGQVFGYAKRTGSNFAAILKDTSDRIGEKMELEQEIHTMIAGKQMEQRIMNIIPLGILAFVDLTSPGFLQVMYEGVLGRAVMTICLVIYGFAYVLAEKLVDIRV